MRKLNVLLAIAHLDIGGAESHLITIAQSLKRRGYGVVVASGGGRLTDLLVREGIKHYYAPIKLNAYIASYFLEWVIKRENIDVVHVHSVSAALAASFASRRRPFPWVATAHRIVGSKRARERAMEEADRVICVSEFTRTSLEQTSNIAPEKMVVIHNGIDLTNFKPQGCRSDLRQEWNLTDEDFVVGVVSRIETMSGKGHAELLQAMIVEDWHSWKLLIVGDGDELPTLKREVRRLNLEARVVFAGHRTDVANILDTIDVLALLSKSENFPLAVLEAMAVAKPVIASPVGGIPEVIEDGLSGFLLREGDIEGIATIIKKLQDNGPLACKIGEEGRKKVKKLYNSEVMIDKITLLYYKVFNEHK